ncbi:MAG: hypothetical protein M0Z78_05050 [Betaproteobacteria bacterium]|nr:hypothetical protein [Betaproteobacteria bacterium]
MKNFIVNAATGTIAAGLGTAGLVFAGMPSAQTETEKAATRAIEEVQSNATRVPASMQDKTISVILMPQEGPKLQFLWRTSMKQLIPINEEIINTAIDTLKALMKVSRSTINVSEQAVYGVALAILSINTALRYLGVVEIDPAILKKGAMGTFAGTLTLGVLASNISEVCKTPRDRTFLSFIPALGIMSAEFMNRNEAIAPEVSAAITSAAYISKTAETMEEATENSGRLILGSAIGLYMGALITMVEKMAKLRGGDERSTNWACGAATLLWGVVLQFSLIDLKNMSASDLLFAWTTISVLSGLIAATIAHVLPRPNEQN